ncbi:uncharacterized protein [Euwallacea similis]|uniref:uncharacterized protein n=1 Tax=Euwallacea similis TaxID=1736056 RepID=UPI00344ECAFD
MSAILVLAVYLQSLTFQHTLLCAAYQYDQISHSNEGNYPYRSDNGARNRETAFYGDNLGNLGANYQPQSNGRQIPEYDNPKASSPVRTSPYWQPVYPFNHIWTIQRTAGLYITPYYLIDPQNYLYRDYDQNDPSSYRFKFDTGNFKKVESSSENGCIQGRFEFEDSNGPHGFSYKSSGQEGLQVKAEGGRNGYQPLNATALRPTPEFIAGQNGSPAKNETRISGQLGSPFENPQSLANLTQNLQQLSSDLKNLLDSYYILPYRKYRSYYFLFDAGSHKTEETSDPNGNIKGYFQYVDDTGFHDLKYETDPKQGFKVTGGNLACLVLGPEAAKGSQGGIGVENGEDVRIVLGGASAVENATYGNY